MIKPLETESAKDRDENIAPHSGDKENTAYGGEIAASDSYEPKNYTSESDTGKIGKAEKNAGKISVKLKRILSRFGKSFSAALFPEDITCDLCGNELVGRSRYNLCAECIEKIEFTKGHRCLVCGAPSEDEADYCLRCQNTESLFRMNRSPLVYDGEGKRLITAFKFGGKKYMAKTLGALMADEFLKNGMSADIALYVPMSENEYKRRGFNQSELLAYEVGARLNMPVLPALVKNRDTSRQKELSGKERAENLNGVFACVFKEIKGRKLLLIDDVFTTGATANECTRTLLKAGAKEVSVLTAAVTKKKLPTE